jgi:hypothetical protein
MIVPMALGQIFTIPSGTSRLIVAQSRTEVPSLGVLNPNDGIAYLKLNGPAGASPPEWDWKLPSQSYGLFPGPWSSLGIYFLDQSGSNRSGDLNVYESQQQFADIPDIQAIGRAIAQAGTTVDISQGTQPQNPPAGAGRLWIDGTGNLHVLQSSGADHTVLDSNNWTTYVSPGYVNGIVNAQALGGVLQGTLPNPTHANINHVFPAGVSAQNFLATSVGQGISGTYPGSVQGPLLLTTGDSGGYSSLYCGPAGLVFVNSANTLRIGGLTNTGSMNISGEFVTVGRISAGPVIANSPGDIGANRGGGAGVIYLGDGSHYLFNPGSGGLFQLVGVGLNITTGPLALNGNLVFSVGTNLLAWPDGSNIYSSGGMVITLPNTDAAFYNSSLGRYNLIVRRDGFVQTIQAGGFLAADSSTRLRMFNQTQMTTTIGSIFTITPGITSFHGIVMIIVNSAQMIMAALQGGAHAVTIIWSNCAATAGFGVGSTFNVGWSASDYFIENRTGQPYFFYVIGFGIS